MKLPHPMFLMLALVSVAHADDRSVASRRASTIASQLAAMPNTYAPGSAQWAMMEMQKKAARDNSSENSTAAERARSQPEFKIPTFDVPKIETKLPEATQPAEADVFSGIGEGSSGSGDLGSMIAEQQQKVIATERASSELQKAAADTLAAQAMAETNAQIARLQLRAAQNVAAANNGLRNAGRTLTSTEVEKPLTYKDPNEKLKKAMASDPLAAVMQDGVKPSMVVSTAGNGKAPSSAGDFSVPSMKGHVNTLGGNFGGGTTVGAEAQVVNLRQ